MAETQRAGAAYKLTLAELTSAGRLQRAAKRRQKLAAQQVRAYCVRARHAALSRALRAAFVLQGAACVVID
jgi:hypothetical protein